MQHLPPQNPDHFDRDEDEPMDDDDSRTETSQLIKNLVRYALACEYSRTPIRRDGIREKGTKPVASCRYRHGHYLTSSSTWLQRANV